MASTSRRFRLKAVGLALAVVGAIAPMPGALAEEAPATFTKKAIFVYQDTVDPEARELSRALENLGRFQMGSLGSDGAGVGGYLKRVQETNGAAKVPAYVFTTRYSLGSPHTTEMKANSTIDKATGKMTGEMYAFLKCPLSFDVAIYEAGTSRVVKQLHFPTSLDRKYKYDFTELTTPDAHRLKQAELEATIAHDLRRPPEEIFEGMAHSEMSSLIHGSVIASVRQMDEFALAVGVSGWDAKSDMVFFGLGSDLHVHVDDGFKVFQNGREIGFLKVRQADKFSSSAQPIFMDGVLKLGDKVVEYNKLNWWNGFKGGMVWMGSPGWMASYDGDIDVGTLFGASELALTYHGAYLANSAVGGLQGELGLSKKWFFRRWGVGVGPRVGVTALNGASNNAIAPGGTLAFSAHCYLTPDIVWTTDLGLTAYTAIDPTKMGITTLAKGARVNPIGPTVQTGFTFVF